MLTEAVGLLSHCSGLDRLEGLDGCLDNYQPQTHVKSTMNNCIYITLIKYTTPTATTLNCTKVRLNANANGTEKQRKTKQTFPKRRSCWTQAERKVMTATPLVPCANNYPFFWLNIRTSFAINTSSVHVYRYIHFRESQKGFQSFQWSNWPSLHTFSLHRD